MVRLARVGGHDENYVIHIEYMFDTLEQRYRVGWFASIEFVDENEERRLAVLSYFVDQLAEPLLKLGDRFLRTMKFFEQSLAFSVVDLAQGFADFFTRGFREIAGSGADEIADMSRGPLTEIFGGGLFESTLCARGYYLCANLCE